MKIEIDKPLSIFGIGRRDNMEDYILPSHGQASEKDRIFTVCDGMGGHAKGEIASKLACEGFSEFFLNHAPASISAQYFLDAFDFVQGLFDSYIERHPESKGMGTTLAMLFLTDDTAVAIHCGDSRVYQFCGQELVWRTQDHKLVNEWVKQGIITAKDSVAHVKSNMITRAIQGNYVLKTKPDIHFITNLHAGDYFLLCTDGLSDSISDNQLAEILSANNSDGEKLNIIRELCEGNSSDNYSAFLLKIKNIAAI